MSNDNTHMEHEKQEANVTKKAWHKPKLSMLNASNTQGGVFVGNETQTIITGVMGTLFMGTFS